MLPCGPQQHTGATLSIYERPTKSLMADWAKENLSPGQTFKRSAAVQWFAEHYPKIK
jgi:endonuclease